MPCTPDLLHRVVSGTDPEIYQGGWLVYTFQDEFIKGAALLAKFKVGWG